MTTNPSSGIAQFVILDVGIPNLAQTSEAVLTSLSNVLSLSQGSHFCAVGLALINASFQPVCGLSNVQPPTKLLRILHALNNIKDTGKCRGRISMEEFQDYIHLGIKTALKDFESLSNQLAEEVYAPEKLQISIFSMKNLSATLKYIQSVLPLFETNSLSKILVIELVDYALDSTCLEKERVSTYLEYFKVAGTVRKLNELMKQWLVCDDTLQHVKLVVGRLSIWCDAMDCLIHPSPTSSADSCQDTVEEVDDDEVLEVIHRLPTEGVCETHIFGDPVVLMPCQRQDHFKNEEYGRLTVNKQYFSDFCSKLGTGDEYLIAKYEKKNQPIRFILLIPGTGFLLAKELVSAEVAFPVPDCSDTLGTHIPPEVDSEVTTALVSLSSIPSFNPSDFSSGLYKHLMKKIKQPTPVKREQEPRGRDLSHETIIVGVEVTKKTKLKRKSASCGKKLKRYPTNKLPHLSESDLQTLDQCLAKQRSKLKMTIP